jgi:hypothetical protein
LPSRSERAFLLASSLLGLGAAAAAPPALEATVDPSSTPSAVIVDVRNSSKTEAVPVTLEGELGGTFETATLASGLPPGESSKLVLHFANRAPGVFPLALRLTYPSAPHGTVLLEHLICLPLPIGAPPSPTVALKVGDISLETAALWPIALTSVDGKPHRATVRIEVPKGLGVSPSESQVEVVPGSPTRVAPRLFRGSMPRGAKVQAWVLVELGDAEPGAAWAQASVTILPDPAIFPRIRIALLILAAALLAAAFWAELRSRRSESDAEEVPPPGAA